MLKVIFGSLAAVLSTLVLAVPRAEGNDGVVVERVLLLASGAGVGERLERGLNDGTSAAVFVVFQKSTEGGPLGGAELSAALDYYAPQAVVAVPSDGAGAGSAPMAALAGVLRGRGLPLIVDEKRGFPAGAIKALRARAGAARRASKDFPANSGAVYRHVAEIHRNFDRMAQASALTAQRLLSRSAARTNTDSPPRKA